MCFEETASLIRLPTDFGGTPGVGLPFILVAPGLFFGDEGDVGDSLDPRPGGFDFVAGGDVSNEEPFKILPSPPCVVSSATCC